MTEEEKAQRLAEWLSKGGDPPEGLDEDVRAAVYALRPVHGPPARVTLEDILAEVREGPFASEERTTGEVIQFPAREEPAAPPAPVALPAPRRRRRPMWPWTVAATMLAAAAAALLVVPMAGRMARKDVAQEETQRIVAPAATPTIPEAEAPAPPAPLAREEAARAAPKSEAKPTAPLADKGRTDGWGAARVEGAPGAGPAPAEPVAAEPAPADETSLLEALGYVEGADAAGEAAPASPPASGGAGLAAPAPAPAPPPPARPQSRAGAKTAATAEKEEADALYDRERPSERKKAKDDDAVDPHPTDYDPGWYRGMPEIEAAYAAASGAPVDAAVAAYGGLFSHPDARAAQDAAHRAAMMLFVAGRYDEALATCAIGLRRSVANTPFRSMLLAVKGDILVAQGKMAEAQRAWAEATALNRDR